MAMVHNYGVVSLLLLVLLLPLALLALMPVMLVQRYREESAVFLGRAARDAAHCGQERGHMWQQLMFPLSRGRLSHRHRFTGRRPTGMNIEVFSPSTNSQHSWTASVLQP